MRNPPVLQEGHPMSTAPIYDEDEEAALEAARHRYQASVLVRDHLESHAVNNPGASSDYVTWIATLHPENAEITVDQRFFIPGNPWWTIYEDTKNDQIPTATAVPISDDDDGDGDGDGDNEQSRQQHQTKDEEDEESVTSNSQGTNASNKEGIDSGRKEHQNDDNNNNNNNLQFCKTCSPVSILSGIIVYILALIGVLICEMMALFLCHFPCTLFYHAAECLSPPNCCTFVLYACFRFLQGIFSFCDSILLLVSVFVTELVALTAYFVGFCTGGVLWARTLHQQIRRLCHGVRILFRKNASKNHRGPTRQFCGFGAADNQTTATTTTATTEQYNGRGGNDIENNAIADPVVSVTVSQDQSQAEITGGGK